MPTPAEYHIVTIADFAKVPDDRLAPCLAEFCAHALDLRQNMTHPDVEMRLESFTWIDDGVPMVKGCNIEIGDQRGYFPNPNFPQPE